MPKEIVKANSCQYSTGKRSSFDPAIGSDDTSYAENLARDKQYSELSFLSGAIGSNDMGYEGGYRSMPFDVAESADEWRTRYDRQRRLRRHTVDQGMSSFSFPKDGSRKLTGDR